MAEEYFPDKKLAKDLNKVVSQLEKADQETIKGIQELITNEEPLTAETRQKIDELFEKSTSLTPAKKKTLKESICKTLENIDKLPKFLTNLLKTDNTNHKMNCAILGVLIVYEALTLSSGAAAGFLIAACLFGLAAQAFNKVLHEIDKTRKSILGLWGTY